MKVRLLVDKSYPIALQPMLGKLIPKGTVVPVVQASGFSLGECWVNTPELEHESYGVLLKPEDYEEVDE